MTAGIDRADVSIPSEEGSAQRRDGRRSAGAIPACCWRCAIVPLTPTWRCAPCATCAGRWPIARQSSPGSRQIEFQSLANEMMAELTTIGAGGLSDEEPERPGPAQLSDQAEQPDRSVVRQRRRGRLSPDAAGAAGVHHAEWQADSAAGAIKKSLDTRLPRLNAILKANGLPELVPSTEEIKPNRPKIAM